MRANLIAAATAVLLGCVSAAPAATLAPHRAVYDLTLDNASDRSGITGINGRMVYEFDGSACDGYTVKFRFVTQIDTAELSRVSDMQTTTYEDGEGRSFDFVTKSFVDDKLDREIKGRAELAGDKTQVEVEKPQPLSATLGASRFPTSHLVDLLERAAAGETFYETTIFDGSDEADRLMTTTVVIGQKGTTQESDPERTLLGALADESFWPVDIAYFDLTTGEELPSYRVSFKLYENGFTRDLLMDYGDFAIKGRLAQLELLDRPANCPVQQ
jgi:hypothetical protein